ncbi:hypothetical protein GCM10020000_26070 [Streptomyces olivoverticillatus]
MKAARASPGPASTRRRTSGSPSSRLRTEGDAEARNSAICRSTRARWSSVTPVAAGVPEASVAAAPRPPATYSVMASRSSAKEWASATAALPVVASWASLRDSERSRMASATPKALAPSTVSETNVTEATSRLLTRAVRSGTPVVCCSRWPPRSRFFRTGAHNLQSSVPPLVAPCPVAPAAHPPGKCPTT